MFYQGEVAEGTKIAQMFTLLGLGAEQWRYEQPGLGYMPCPMPILLAPSLMAKSKPRKVPSHDVRDQRFAMRVEETDPCFPFSGFLR